MDSDPSTSTWAKDLRQNVLSCLTKLSHASTPFITTFILIHLTAPAMANLGGSSLSSQTMLLGREYYQTSFGEKYLVIIPLVTHAISGCAKRLLSSKPQKRRPLTSLLATTGYSTMLFFLPIHYMTHRLHPTSLAPPISSVGPSEIDYEFVKTGLHQWPITSWFLYTGLVLSVAAHATDGAIILWKKYLKTGPRAERENTWWRIGSFAGLSLPALTGLYMITQEPLMIFPSFMKRLEAVFTCSWIYRL